MRNYLLWILAIVALSGTVRALPLGQHRDQWRPSTASDVHLHPRYQHPLHQPEPGAEVLSTRVTSSVAVNRPHRKYRSRSRTKSRHHPPHQPDTNSDMLISPVNDNVAASEVIEQTEVPPELAGANIEYIKQINAKKEAKQQIIEPHPFYLNLKKNASNDSDINDTDDTNDSAVEESEKVISEVPLDNYEVNSQYSENVPIARSVSFSPSPINFIHKTRDSYYNERKNSARLTTAISFNIVHDDVQNAPVEVFSTVTEASTTTTTTTVVAETQNPVIPPQPVPYVQEQAKVYSQPAKVYSVPAKFYSEPAKIYSEPAKVYSEPAKIYSEPAKIYSVPAKFYSKPASLHLDPEPVEPPSSTEVPASTSLGTTEISTLAELQLNDKFTPSHEEHEKNYEIDEKVSVDTEGKMHGIQENDDCKHDNCKVGYVVEGRQYRKYRVEERTADGYIVGEYGVVRNEDGALRGVRYTADSEASPRLIYDALMKFLQLR